MHSLLPHLPCTHAEGSHDTAHPAALHTNQIKSITREAQRERERERFTSSAGLCKEERPILFLHIEIMFCPHTEKPETPSLYPLNTLCSALQFLSTYISHTRKQTTSYCKQHNYLSSRITFSNPIFAESCQEN